MTSKITSALEHRYIKTNGIQLHVVLAGDPANPPVLMLHGFPEFWYGWHHQIDGLVEAGFYLIIPDQRGYNLSDKPNQISAYTLDELSRDAVGLLDALGLQKAYLVSHDWGAAVAWWTAARFADRFHRLTILNVPHPSVMMEAIQSNPRQLLKSWYILFFQIPKLPEFLMTVGGAQNAARMLFASGKPTTFDDADIAEYTRAWQQPNAMRSMIHWYRALMRNPVGLENEQITIPTFIIWGKQDIALEFQSAEKSLDYCANGELFVIEDATHWVQHDAPHTVTTLITNFLQKS